MYFFKVYVFHICLQNEFCFTFSAGIADFYSMSYLWFSGLSVIVSFGVGIIMSLILGELTACQYSHLSSLFSDSQAGELENMSSSEFQLLEKLPPLSSLIRHT